MTFFLDVNKMKHLLVAADRKEYHLSLIYIYLPLLNIFSKLSDK